MRAFLLVGLIAVYIKIFLIPLFIHSIFSINALRSLFVSPAIPYFHICESVGFGFDGLGGTLAILSVFEIIGLTILLYLSTE